MQCLFVLLCVVACALAADNFEDCGSKFGKVKAVKVNGKDKCELKRDGRDKVQIDFEPTADSKLYHDVDVLATAFVNGKELDKPIEKSNACKYKTLDCPLKKGEAYSYQNYLYPPDFPEENFDIKWVIKKDEVEDIVICFKMPCVIV